MKFRNTMKRYGAQLGAGLTGVAFTGLAFAQGGGAAVTFDPAPVIAIVDQATTFVTTIGLAVLIFLMVAKGIKWARKAG
jgi:hypothetical protein